MAADLFVVPTVTFRLLFVLVILGHDRRRIVHTAVTADRSMVLQAFYLLIGYLIDHQQAVHPRVPKRPVLRFSRAAHKAPKPVVR